MPLDLYYCPMSPHCRAVRLTARALGLELNLHQVDVQKMETLSAEFLQMNPQHTVPTLADDGFVLWESRAILMYLADKYGKTDSLYPRDPAVRAAVNQLLFFDVGTLYQRAAETVYPVMKGEPWDFGLVKRLETSVRDLDVSLAASPWAAGRQITIADLSLACTVSHIEAVAGVDVSSFANLRRWYANCRRSIDGWKDITDESVRQCVNLFNRQVRQSHNFFNDQY